jgi:glycogenin glucosyltransferase
LPYLEDRISDEALCITREAGWEPIAVPFIRPPHNGKGIHYRFYDQYTKLNIWALDKHGIQRAVYLDADTLVRKNFDELFDIPFNFAAVPDVYGDKRGFTIGFNAGVLAFHPSSAVLDVMKERIETADFPPEQAEQAFLNAFYATNALRLPYAYNANLAVKGRSPAMWEGLKDEMRVVHYTLVKPFIYENQGSTKILTEEGQRGAILEAAKQRNGMFAEEVRWWGEVYNEMMENMRGKINKCYR